MKRNLANIDTDMFTPVGRLLQQGMAHGLTNDMIYGGLVTGQTALQGLRIVQATKNCVIGTRRVTWDGRVFKYGLSVGACHSGRGVAFMAQSSYGFPWNTIGDSYDIGDTKISMAANTHPAFDKDELVGGYILISDSEDALGNDAHPQSRIIIANDASLENGVLNLTLGSGLSRAITILTYAGIMINPWSKLKWLDAAGVDASKAGVPAVYVPVAARYFWTQTWGPCWVAQQAAVGISEHKQVVFRHDGSVGDHDDSDIHEEYQQHAGFTMHNTAGNSLMIFLQVSI